MTDTSHELRVERYIDAPPEHVWTIMTERMAEWWCPRPWKTDIIELDRRPGGRSAMVLRGPEGEEHALEGIYLAYEPGRRFVTTDALDAEFHPREAFMVGIWEIAPEGAGTRYTATARHWTAEAAKQHKDMGFEKGWGACADQLKELAEAS